ncbi:hypothetical protein [Burkholderia guangdongensis]|uniref:hypothetical protein n=1 Tax=Burkholderia guangdongensis TaxID=1792500 RepID=UPI0015CA8DDA|nr:hypothetical protein [Burkholderia guangdongensis]
MKNRVLVYSIFGAVLAISLFEGFGAPFIRSADFDFRVMFMAGGASALGFGIFRRIGRKLNALADLPNDWRLETGRWFFPFLLIALMPPMLGAFIGYLLRESPMAVIALMSANVVLTPLTYGILAMRVTKEPLVHVCFSSLLAWSLMLPFGMLNGQPPQLWFAGFPFSALLAVVGYLAAQGIKAIRNRFVAI